MGQAKRRQQNDRSWGLPLLYEAFFMGDDSETLFSVQVQVPRRANEHSQDTAAVQVGKLLHWVTMYRVTSDARKRAIERLGFTAESWADFVVMCDQLPSDAWVMELWPSDGPAVYAGYGGNDLDKAKALRGHEGPLHQTDERSAGVGVGVVR